MKVKLLELFGGIGAPRKALENIGIEVKSVDYVEILKDAVKAYNAMYDHDYIEQDILEWNSEVDLLVHGSPCVDFSKAGKNDLSSGRSILYQRTLEIIRNELHPRPKYVLWENVVGLLTNKHISHFYHYLNAMEEMGYRNYYGVINATEMGTPQSRNRVFTVSIRNDIDQTFDFDILHRHELKPIREYLIDFANSKPSTQPWFIDAIKKHKIRIIIDRTPTISTRQERWDGGVCINDENFYNQDFTDLPKSKAMSGYTIEEFLEYFPEYRNKPLSGMFRYLTPKECWLLQGFSEQDFEKASSAVTSNASLYKLAGNSICVQVLEEIFRELLIEKRSQQREINLLEYNGENE